MVAVQQYACLALVVEEGAEVDPANHMPAPLELLLKTFFNVLSCIFQICDFVLDHLNIDVLSYQQSVLFHVNLHIAELDVS